MDLLEPSLMGPQAQDPAISQRNSPGKSDASAKSLYSYRTQTPNLDPWDPMFPQGLVTAHPPGEKVLSSKQCFHKYPNLANGEPHHGAPMWTQGPAISRRNPLRKCSFRNNKKSFVRNNRPLILPMVGQNPRGTPLIFFPRPGCFRCDQNRAHHLPPDPNIFK